MYGYEVVPQAITDAHKNAHINGIENATFIQGDLNKIGEDFGNNFPKPDIVISGYNLLHIVALLKLCSLPILFPLLRRSVF